MKKSVLVTGASGGVGRAAVLALAGRGYTVYAGIRGPVPELAAHPDVRPVMLDVTDPVAAESAAAQIAEETDGLHAVVNNAGIIVQGPLELVPPAELRRQFEVNVFGPSLVTAAMLPLLRAGGGRVVNVSAPTAHVAMPFMGPIGASKAALESLSDALRQELSRWAIPVSIVVPGAMDTAIFAKAEKAAAASLATAPPDRVGLYTPALEALGAAAAKMTYAPVDAAVKAITAAVEARRPKRRYVAGRDASAALLLTRLPARTRDRLISRLLGLNTLPT